ncbi:MAG: secretin N-terminal domain-containing protein [Acidobacteriota bacterium]|nr:secretin N-terminal domain-containing protein [Acidobacteriota bacterium]
MILVFLAALMGGQISAVVFAGSIQEEFETPVESISGQEAVEPEEVDAEQVEQVEQEELLEPPDTLSQEELLAREETPDSSLATSEEVSQSPQNSSPGMVFQFTNVPLTTVVDTVMRELGYSYVTSPGVGGSASIYTMGEIPKENAFSVLEQLLQMNGMGIVKQDDLYVLIPLAQTTTVPHGVIVDPQSSAEAQEPSAPDSQLSQEEFFEAQPVVSTFNVPQEESDDDARPGGVLTYVIPLNYVPSTEMLTMVTPFVSAGAHVIDYASANMLMITDFRKNVDQVLKLVKLLDTDYFDRTTVDLIPILYNTASTIAGDLAQIFSPTGGKSGGVRFVTIERLNSLLVITRSASVFKKVQEWVQKLDTTSSGTNIKTFVYPVENNTAGNIANILSQLYSEGLGFSSGQGQSEGGEPVQSLATRSEPASGPFSGSGLGPTLQGRPISRQSGINAVVAPDLKIIVNEFNNSMIIQATEADYQFLLQTIKQLDVLPRQVLLEAKLYSVELKDDLSFGVAAFLKSRDEAVSGPATLGQMASEGSLSVATQAFFGSMRTLEMSMNSLRSKTNVELLHAPRILAIDGAQAQINVGAEVPVTTASFGDPLQSGTTTNFVNSIQFRPTGVTLLIFPRISAGGVVAMDISVEVSSAAGAALTPTINTNSVTTSLIVRDGQTVALAGIISDTMSSSRDRVPLLGDIPILGTLFGRTTRLKRRAELIFFITPRVIHNLPTATELTLEFKRAMQKAYGFVDKKEAEQRDLIQKRIDQELKNKQQ